MLETFIKKKDVNKGERVSLSYLVSDSFRGFAAAEKRLKAQSGCPCSALLRCIGEGM